MTHAERKTIMHKDKKNTTATRVTYTEQEVADLLGVHRTTIRRIAKSQREECHEILRACLNLTPSKRVYIREIIDDYIAGPPLF